MRLRGFLPVSMLLNVALAAALIAVYRQRPPPVPMPRPIAAAVAMPLFKTNVVVRRQNFTWDEIESSDFKKYIANLRLIGCPEDTIRDIIVAEVDATFDQRRAAEVITPEQQWWRADPDPAVAEAAARSYETLEKERRILLTELLGANWDKSHLDELARFNLLLDGPVLGRLPAETKEALRQLGLQATQRRTSLIAAAHAAGHEPAAAEMARLHQQTRADLARLLNSAQLEEYLLRYSETARVLREETRGLGLGPEEFRRIFRARDEVEQQLQLAYSGEQGPGAAAREELVRKREAAVREALGPERYQLYRYIQDPLFRNAQAIAQTAKARPEQVVPLYQIAQAVEEERRRIRADQAMTPEARTAALERVVLEREQSLRKLLGDEAYERYREQQDP